MPIKILAIDDDRHLTELFAATMRIRGYEIITANSGEEGLAKLEETSPDVILLDLIMPDRDGWDVCKTIRSLNKSVPIVILSALSNSGTIAAALDAGADDYLIKPIPTAILVARINTLLRRANAEKKAASIMEEKENYRSAFQG